MGDPTHFDRHAENYRRFRPPYPDALWARLLELRILRRGTRVLELGAGTGEATIRFVEQGASVTAVEPGIAMADRLRERAPDAQVIIATAEAAALPDAAFDIAVVATAVHWLDLEIVVPKVHRVLRPGGRLAVWRTVFGDPEVSTPFRERVSAIVATRRQPRRASGLDTHQLTRELTAGGRFVECHTEALRWSIDLDADQIRGLFSTFSDWSPTEVSAAARAVDDLGGKVTEYYVTPLIVLDRVDA